MNALVQKQIDTISKNIDIITENIKAGLAEAGNDIDEITKIASECVPDKDPKKLCQYTAKIQKITKLIEKFSSYSNYITETIDLLNKLSKELGDNVVAYIKNKLNILTLYIKQSILWVQLKLAKLRRNLLVLAAQGKIAPALQAIFGAIIIAIQAIFTAISAIIAVLDKILLLIPFVLALAIEGMSFFLTPKSITTGSMSTPMTIANTNQSVERIIPTSIITTINQILDAPLYVMGENKKIAMAASAAASATAVMNKNLGTNLVIVPANISYKAREYLLLAINVILAVLPVAEPLPKYERLPIWKNLGFFIWLLTGWCMAGKRAFGLPGFP